MCKYSCRKYKADSKRGSGDEKVIAILLTSPSDILEKNNNCVLSALESEGLSSSIGVYFYRFKKSVPFIKIGECTREEGISVRFSRGWHGTKKYSDTYQGKKIKDQYVDSEFLNQVNKISETNPAYFVFYEHSTMQSHPKIDEMFAYRMHKKLFRQGTLIPERMNGNPFLARKLIWHKSAFSEVFRCRFPDGSDYV